MFRLSDILRFTLLCVVVVGPLETGSLRGQTIDSSLAADRASITSVSPVPRLVTFAGTLRDQNGKPLNGVQAVTFALYKTQYYGSPLWLETQNVNADADGRFAVFLGINTSNGLPLDLFTTGQAQWVGFQTGSQLEQRVFLASVPYALATVDGSTANTESANKQVESSSISAAAAPTPATFSAQQFTATGPDGPNYVSNATSGPPLQVSSNARVPNLNADLLDGLHATSFPILSGSNVFTGTQTVNGGFNIATSAGANYGIVSLAGTAFMHNFGLFNTSVGPNAGSFSSTGSSNTAIGATAMQSNTSGSANTATGFAALQQNTVGGRNTASGFAALSNNTVGSENTATGYYALQKNNSGNGNVANGWFALGNNTTGVANTATGWNALGNNSTASNNTAAGSFALGNNTIGVENTAQGADALASNSTGNNNTAVGASTLAHNSAGNANTAVGTLAGRTTNLAHANTTGSNNTFVGYNSGPGTSTQLNNATAIGANALVSADNSLVLGDGAANVGIGTTTPTAKLEVIGDIKIGGAGNGIKFPDGTTQMSAAAGGDITAVTAGAGLLGGGNSGDVILSIDTSVIQNRITASCSVGSSIRQINFDGSVICQTDANSGGTVASVGTGLGLTGGPITTTGAIAIDTAIVPRLNATNVFTATQTIDGSLILPATTSPSSGVINVGGPFAHNFGSQNTFVGLDAGNFSLTGPSNTAVGTSALKNNTSGSGNIAAGTFALLSNTSGSSNTALGSNSLQANSSGSSNTAVGNSTLLFNTTGIQNTAIGYLAMHDNTTGSGNTAAGVSALKNGNGSGNTAFGLGTLQGGASFFTGSENTAIGVQALREVTSGLTNTAAGYGTLLFNTTGSNNSALGGGALFYNTTGGSNTAIGGNAGVTANTANANTTGSNNTFIGFNSGPGTSTQLNNATAIGANALVTVDNSIVLGDSAVKVGIGTNAPVEKLEVTGNIKVSGEGNGIKFSDGTTQTTAATGMGDITSITVGSGLTGGGTSGDVTIRVDTAVMQIRVTGTCPTGSSIRLVNEDGTVSCQTNSGGTVTSVATGVGLIGGPITSSGTVAIDTSVVPQLSAPNVFTNNNTIAGNLTLGGSLNGGLIIQSNPTSPNVIGGSAGNTVNAGVVGATISGGGQVLNGWINRVVSDFGTVGGGRLNVANGNSATIGGGGFNTANGLQSTIGGGSNNTANDQGTVVGGGNANTASSSATISGGRNNTASNDSAIGGGVQNLASGFDSTIAGGSSNLATGNFSAVPGGLFNSATGLYSFAAGRRAKSNHNGSFVWGDSTDADVVSSSTNEFTVRALGGVRFFTDAGLTTGCSIPSGGGSWSCTSDRNMKENFTPVDGKALLDRLSTVPVLSWNYRSQNSSIRHIGPTAQDFYTAFSVGEDDKHIATVDADGVALAGLQTLYQMLLAKDAQIQRQQIEIQSGQTAINALESDLRQLRNELTVLSRALLPRLEN